MGRDLLTVSDWLVTCPRPLATVAAWRALGAIGANLPTTQFEGGMYRFSMNACQLQWHMSSALAGIGIGCASDRIGCTSNRRGMTQCALKQWGRATTPSLPCDLPSQWTRVPLCSAMAALGRHIGFNIIVAARR